MPKSWTFTMAANQYWIPVPAADAKPTIGQRIGTAYAWAGTILGHASRIFAVLLALGLAVVLGIAFVMSMTEEVVVEAVQIPKSLQDRGYSGDRIAQRLIDDFNHISAASKTRIERSGIGLNSTFAEFEKLMVPSSDVSMQAVISLLRRVLRRDDDRIVGEITVLPTTADKAPEQYEFRIRVNINRNTPVRVGKPGSSRHSVKAFRGGNIDDLVRQAAEFITLETNPQVLASHLYAGRRWKELDALLPLLTASDKVEISSRAMVLSGRRLLDRRDVEGAVEMLERAASMRQSMFATVKLGEALVEAREYERAIVLFQAARSRAEKELERGSGLWPFSVLQSKPRRPVSGLLIASWAAALHRQGQSEAALALLDKESKTARSHPTLHVQWGDILRDRSFRPAGGDDCGRVQQGSHREAIAKYQEAINRDPGNGAAHAAWGMTLSRLGDMDGALKQFERAIEADPKAAEPHYYKARILLERGRQDQAIAAFRQAVTNDDEYAPGILGLAEALGEKGEFAEAFEFTTKAATLGTRIYDYRQEWRFGTFPRDRCPPEPRHERDIFLSAEPWLWAQPASIAQPAQPSLPRNFLRATPAFLRP